MSGPSAFPGWYGCTRETGHCSTVVWVTVDPARGDIKVADNGVGIPGRRLGDVVRFGGNDDVEPTHRCFGWRRRTLAALALISDMDVCTRTARTEGVPVSDGGLHRVRIRGGTRDDDGDRPSEPLCFETGTVVSVRDLFYNRPIFRALLLQALGEAASTVDAHG